MSWGRYPKLQVFTNIRRRFTCPDIGQKVGNIQDKDEGQVGPGMEDQDIPLRHSAAL